MSGACAKSIMARWGPQVGPLALGSIRTANLSGVVQLDEDMHSTTVLNRCFNAFACVTAHCISAMSVLLTQVGTQVTRSACGACLCDCA